MPRERKPLPKSVQRTPKGKFAMRIAALIDERGWSVATAAERFGVGEAAVYRWLRAETVPETLDLMRIGKALDVPGYPFPDYRELLPPE